MADTVTSRTIFNGPRHLVMSFTNFSDGTGETAVKKVDATLAANGIFYQGQTIVPGVHLKITRIEYDVQALSVRLQWEATANQDAVMLSGFGDFFDYTSIGGLANPGTTALPGSTGSILFTTVGQAAGSSYTVTLYMSKGIPQN